MLEPAGGAVLPPYLAVGGQADVEVAYGVLGQGAVVPGLPHEGEPAAGLLGAVPDLGHHQGGDEKNRGTIQ